MDVVRTPEERFDGLLPGYPFEPNYVEIADGEGGTLRVYHVDEGDPAAPVVLLLHGEQSWSYLYRHMIPVLVDAGLRAVAPDLVGFGRSDKPARREDYTFARHVRWLTAHLVEGLDLRDIQLRHRRSVVLDGVTVPDAAGPWTPTRSASTRLGPRSTRHRPQRHR